MKVAKIITCAAVVAALTGCASVSTPLSRMKPATKLLDQTAGSSSAGANILVKRDDAFQGGFCTYRISIDKTPVAEIGSGQYVYLKVTTGRHIISAQSFTPLCPGDLMQQAADVQGEMLAFRIRVGQNAFSFEPTLPE